MELADGRIATCSKDNSIKLWKKPATQFVIEHTLWGHKQGVLNIIQLRSGHILSCGGDGTIRIWSLETCRCLSVIEG
eukprot:UN33195